MNRPRWEELHSYWEDDGALVDAFNDDLTEEDWQRLLDALHRSTWPLEWDAEPLAPAPRTSDELFRLVDEGFGRLVLLLPEGIRVHCYAHGSFGSDVPYPTSCECDFAKSQVRPQAHLDIFGGFVPG